MSDSGSDGMDECVDNAGAAYFDDGEESESVCGDGERGETEGRRGRVVGRRSVVDDRFLRWKRSWRRWRKNTITRDDQVSLDSGCLMSVLA